jgi:hypothetical protein
VVEGFHSESSLALADAEVPKGVVEGSLAEGEGALEDRSCVGAAYQSCVEDRCLWGRVVDSSPPAQRFPPMMAAAEDDAAMLVSVADGPADGLADRLSDKAADGLADQVADGLALELHVSGLLRKCIADATRRLIRRDITHLASYVEVGRLVASVDAADDWGARIEVEGSGSATEICVATTGCASSSDQDQMHPTARSSDLHRQRELCAIREQGDDSQKRTPFRPCGDGRPAERRTSRNERVCRGKTPFEGGKTTTHEQTMLSPVQLAIGTQAS